MDFWTERDDILMSAETFVPKCFGQVRRIIASAVIVNSDRQLESVQEARVYRGWLVVSDNSKGQSEKRKK